MMGWLRVFAAMAAWSGMTNAVAATCTADDFAIAVDQSGASLRAFTKDAQPKLQTRMKRYSEVRKLPTDGYEDAALDAIQDGRLADFDDKSATMLLQIDQLGRIDKGATPDCGKLGQIKELNRQLLAVMKAKSEYMLERLDAKIGEASPGATPAERAEVSKPAPKKKPVTVDPSSGDVALAKPNPAAPKSEPVESEAPTVTEPAKPSDAFIPPPDEAPPQADEGFSVDEIRAATQGFFGTVSTGLASVIEHSFKTTGRPTAYVLGTEGGGAFFAGLRFGQGTLFMRNMPGTRPVYWHGPSLGTDFGASGSRTMFLIYRLPEPDALFRSFTGVDGSAYIVGGVGVTLLKGGQIIMAPIRSGLGLRIGASIGYLRFSDQPTWNPF